MQNNSSQENKADVVERLYFASFPTDKTNEFRRLLLYVTYKTIEHNKRITLSKLSWHLNTRYSFSDSDVMIAVNALSNPIMFEAVTKYTIPETKHRKEITQLSIRTVDKVNDWIDNVLKIHSEFATLTPEIV